jgi:glutamine synthetase
MEYFLFERGDPDTPLVPLDSGGFFDLTTADVASDIRRVTLEALEDMGIPVEYSFHENSPSQHEIDLRYTDALSMADNVMLFRLIVREVAMSHGVYATFMPQPIENVQGSGMHLHMSLFEGEDNAFADIDDEFGLSPTAKYFMAGVLHHARELTAITNQTVNSYKRLVAGGEAPITLTWARTNWAALLRVPTIKKGKEASTRLELRAPDPACNPYLAFAVILAAGLKGIAEQYDLPAEAPSNLFHKSPYELRSEGHALLPLSLDEALAEMERSELVASVLGDHLFEWFLRNKRVEWAEYKAQVTPMELRRYLPSM